MSKLVTQCEMLQKQQQKSDFDSRHHARNLQTLPLGSTVFLPDCQETGHVKQLACRSYIVSIPSGKFCQNRRHINQLPGTPQTVPETDNDHTESNTSPIMEQLHIQ